MSEGGIALPDASIQALPYGTVIQVGPEVKNQASPDGQRTVKGSVVLFDPISAIPLSIKKDHVLIEPEDILAILEEGDY